MDITVQKWDNSIAIKIPEIFAKGMNIQKGSHLDLLKVKDKLILKPRTGKITLKKMLSGITEDNIHSETKTGKVVGNEIW